MFLNLPADGWPVIVDAHPTDSQASDLLGGAIPVHVGVTPSLGVLVREDCRNMPLNVAASYVCSRIAMQPVPVLGPAVIVKLESEIVVELDDGESVKSAAYGDMVCFDANTAAVLDRLAQDALHVSQGLDGKLPPSSRATRDVRASLMRGMFELLNTAAGMLPADYPDARYERGDLTADASDTAATGDPRFII